MVARLSAAAERAGVLARFDLVRPANTFDAHRVLHFANEAACRTCSLLG